MVRLTATDKGLVVFVDCGRWGSVDGASGAIRGREWTEVDVCKTVGLDYVLCVGFLGKVEGQRTILVGRPFEVRSKEPVDWPHIFYIELGSKQTFKATLDLWVLGEVDKIVDLEAQLERLVCGRGLVARELRDACGVAANGRRRDTLVEARVVQTG